MTATTILDHGYLKLIEHWGSDERIVEAARMSTDKGFLGWGPLWKCRACGCVWRDNNDGSFSLRDKDQKSCQICEFEDTTQCCTYEPGDERLLRYLYTNRHETPFEMAGLIIEVQAPIFVFREWHRHRTQSYNELSARYTPLPDVNYMPTVDRCLIVNGANKQANAVVGAEELTHEAVLQWLGDLEAAYHVAEQVYQKGLRIGIPKEVARLPVPVGRYSRMRASANLRNWLAFLTLRADKAAQWEIRQFAYAVAEIIEEKFPRTFELFVGRHPITNELQAFKARHNDSVS